MLELPAYVTVATPDALKALHVAAEVMVDRALSPTTNEEADHRACFDALTLLDILRHANIPSAADALRDELVNRLHALS